MGVQTSADDLIDSLRDNLKETTKLAIEANAAFAIGDLHGVDTFNKQFREDLRKAADLIQQAHELIRR